MSRIDIINKLRRIRQIAKEKSRLSLSMAVPDDANVTEARKILECVFADSQIRINLHLGKKHKGHESRGPRQVVEPSNRRERHMRDRQVTNEEADEWHEVKCRR